MLSIELIEQSLFNIGEKFRATILVNACKWQFDRAVL